MNMFTRATMALAVPALSLTALAAPSYGVDTDTTEVQPENVNLKATSDGTAPTVEPIIISPKASFLTKKVTIKACKAYARKLEQQAPPRDPQAKCKGKIKVEFSAKVVTPPCPTGWIGGSAELSVNYRQKMLAKSFAKSIANGDVRTWASMKIYDKVKIKGWVKTDCIMIPIVTPPPPPVPTPDYKCLSFSLVKGDGRTVRVNAFSTAQSGGASFQDATINWGDGSQSNPTSSPIGATHTFNDYGTFLVKVSTKFNVNGQEKVTNDAACQAVVTFTAPPPPPPPPAENNPPTGTISGLPHQYSNATDSNVAYVYWMTRDSDGDTVTYNNFRVINSGGATAHAGNVLPSTVLADGTACPTGAKCYRGEVWAGTTPGSASVAVDITDGKSAPVTLSAGPWTIFADDRGE